MLNSVEAAVDTLEDAGALKFTISQIPHFKQAHEATTTQELIDKFLKAWENLTPGIYKVDYAKSSTDTRSSLCFRVSKVGSPAGSPGALADIGRPNDVIMGFQQQIWNLQTDMRVKELQDNHTREMEALKRKYETGDEMDPGMIMGGIGKIENILRMVNGKAPLEASALPAVAGPEDAAADAGAAELGRALETLQQALGDETLVATMQKLAAKAKSNPAGLKGALGYIDML